jgi:hypothetical protein
MWVRLKCVNGHRPRSLQAAAYSFIDLASARAALSRSKAQWWLVETRRRLKPARTNATISDDLARSRSWLARAAVLIGRCGAAEEVAARQRSHPRAPVDSVSAVKLVYR